MKIIKPFFPVVLLIAACAASGIAQTGGDKGTPNSTQSTISNLPQGWRIYNLGSKDGFKVAMPAKPTSESETIKTGNDTTKVTYYTSSSDDIVTIIADMTELPLDPERMSEETKLFLFKKVREGIVEGMKSELDKSGVRAEIKFYPQKSVALRGASGYELDLDVGTLKGRTRMLTVKDHIYIFFTLLIDGSKESLMNDFLDSFNYTGAK